MSWTPEREAEARRLWDEGQSASSIARTLGGVTRVAVIGKLHRMGLGRETRAEIAERVKVAHKAKLARKAICAVQGCGSVLVKSNMMGVCLAHRHAAGLCRCPQCTGGLVAARAAPKDRPHVRQATVPRFGTSTSGGEATVRVSLLREPWASP
jgi:predicted transcriptional regulator